MRTKNTLGVHTKLRIGEHYDSWYKREKKARVEELKRKLEILPDAQLREHLRRGIEEFRKLLAESDKRLRELS